MQSRDYRAETTEQRVESVERRVQSGSEAAQSKTRRHRAETGRQILKTQFGFLFKVGVRSTHQISLGRERLEDW
jgi:hypothetical protein